MNLGNTKVIYHDLIAPGQIVFDGTPIEIVIFKSISDDFYICIDTTSRRKPVGGSSWDGQRSRR